MQIIAAVALYDRVPPPSSTPEMDTFVFALNAELRLVRRQIEESCHR